MHPNDGRVVSTFIVQALRARAAGAPVAPPIPRDEILEVSRVTIEVAAGFDLHVFIRYRCPFQEVYHVS